LTSARNNSTYFCRIYILARKIQCDARGRIRHRASRAVRTPPATEPRVRRGWCRRWTSVGTPTSSEVMWWNRRAPWAARSPTWAASRGPDTRTLRNWGAGPGPRSRPPQTGPGRAPRRGGQPPLLARLGVRAATALHVRTAPSVATIRRILNAVCPGGLTDLSDAIPPELTRSRSTARASAARAPATLRPRICRPRQRAPD
jgi:hypothetical protein